MQLNVKEFDVTLERFLNSWPISRVENMTIEEYSDLSNHDSFCYWLEYGSKYLGAIGGIALHKFELWKSKAVKELKDNRFVADNEFVWSRKMGLSSIQAFDEIKKRILDIIRYSQEGNWQAIETVSFHSIGKWKIAFLYSNKELLPIYSKIALLPIAKGLGKEFTYHTPIYELQEFILSQKSTGESIDDFAYKVYTQFADKKTKRSYFIVGSKYGDENGNDTIPKIKEFVSDKCIAIGFLDWKDFSSYMGADKGIIDRFVDENWKSTKPAWHKMQRTFNLLSQIREGDIIAVKSHGAYNKLTIIAYAEVVARDGSIYKHDPGGLGHTINVEFLDINFETFLGLTYAETIHKISPTDRKGHFSKIFGLYHNQVDLIESLSEDEKDSDYSSQINGITNLGNNTFNYRSEDSYLRSSISSTKVTRIHNAMQNRFIEYLRATYLYDNSNIERRRMDAYLETAENFIIYEIKPFNSPITCIREGIGQLIDYYHALNTEKYKKIVVVGPRKPEETDILFIESVRSMLKYPFAYLYFDKNTHEAIEY